MGFSQWLYRAGASSRLPKSRTQGGQRGILVSLPRWGVTAVNPSIAIDYQMNFSANCICLEDVVVGLVNRPAMLFVVPSGFKTLRFALLGGL